MTYQLPTEYEFNGRKYEIKRDDKDGRFLITRDDGKSLGTAAAIHGAFHACTLDAYPSAPRRSLRIRP